MTIAGIALAASVVSRPDGSLFLPGECQFQLLTEPLRRRLGDSYDAVLTGIIGETDPEKIMAALGYIDVSESSGPVILSPGEVPDALLNSLTHVTIALQVPPDWAGPYVIGTRIAEGWNEAASLATELDKPILLGAYLGADRRLEVWLLDGGGDVSAPIQLPATLDLSNIDQRSMRNLIRTCVWYSLILSPSTVAEVSRTSMPSMPLSVLPASASA